MWKTHSGTDTSTSMPSDTSAILRSIFTFTRSSCSNESTVEEVLVVVVVVVVVEGVSLVAGRHNSKRRDAMRTDFLAERLRIVILEDEGDVLKVRLSDSNTESDTDFPDENSAELKKRISRRDKRACMLLLLLWDSTKTSKLVIDTCNRAITISIQLAMKLSPFWPSSDCADADKHIVIHFLLFTTFSITSKKALTREIIFSWMRIIVVIVIAEVFLIIIRRFYVILGIEL
jgi:hypothetical protein